METLKRVIISGSGVLTLICFISALVFATLDAPDIALVTIISGIPMLLIFCITRMLWDEYDDDGYYPESSTKPEPEKKTEKKTIVIKNTRCSACGAPLEDEVCRYCGTRAVIYKTIT